MTSIRISGVQTKPSDLRPVTKGWGQIHYLFCAHFIWMFPLLIAGAVAINVFGYVDIPVFVLLPLLVVGFICWRLTNGWIYRRIMVMTLALPVLAPADWTLNEEGVEVVVPLARSFWAWGGIHDVVEENDRFVVLIQPYSNHILPKRCLSAEQLEAVRNLIAAIKAQKRPDHGVDYGSSSSDKA